MDAPLTSSGSTLAADARELGKYVKRGSITLTITSPPYFNMKNYGGVNQIGYGQSLPVYLQDLTDVFQSLYKATKKNGVLWLMIDNVQINKEVYMLPFEVANRLKEVGWKLRQAMVWDKAKGHPGSSTSRFRKVYEHILFFSKGDDYKLYVDRIKDYQLSKWWVGWPERYHLNGRTPTDIWQFLIPTQGTWGGGLLKHECPFPPRLLERMVKLCSDPGDFVFDPFAGTGMVPAVAEYMGRRSLGLDASPKYQKMFGEARKYASTELSKKPHNMIHEKDILGKIYILRKLKLGRLIARTVARTASNSLVGVFVVDSQIDLQIHVVFDMPQTLDGSEHDFPLSESDIRNLVPVSKYVSNVKIQLWRLNDFLAEIDNNIPQKSLWLYFKHNMFSRSINVKNWTMDVQGASWRKMYSNRGIAPIMSNLYIYQKEIDYRVGGPDDSERV